MSSRGSSNAVLFHSACSPSSSATAGASGSHLRRLDQDVQILKVTKLTDARSLAVLDLQCLVRWELDTNLGSQVVQPNAGDLLSVAADKGFHDWMSKFEFYTLDVDPLVLERGSSLEKVSHNVLIRESGYSQ